MLKKQLNKVLLACTVALALGAGGGVASAQDKVRFMKVVPHPFAFLIADVGVEKGIFAKHNLVLDISASSGDARLQQAMAAGEVDIGISSGTSLGFAAKGSPIIGFLATHDAPLNMSIVVTPNSKLAAAGKSAADLKGAKIGVSTPGSMSYFLARRMAVEQGWKPEEITPVPLGGLPALLAAAEAGNIDGFVMSIDVGYELEEKKAGKVFVSFGDVIEKFHTHALLVTNDFRKKNPDVVRRFAAAWLESAKFVMSNKQAMVDVAVRELKMSPAVASKSYDLQAPAFSTTGRFSPAALEVIGAGLIETEILSKKPDMSTLYTEEYLPKAN